MKEFAASLAVDDPNAAFWWDYMTMVSIVLCFTRAQRDGLWDLHLYAFKRRLPFFFRYNHINYARWDTVYLAEMSALPPEILLEFQKGNFVVKRSDRRFNQVSADQNGGDTLKNIINKDVVTPEIQESLLGAEHLGQAQMKVFVDKRVCEPPDSDQHLGLKSPIRKNKAKTFASLYEVVQLSKNKQNTIKVDRQILQRLVTVYRAGRKVDLENVLQHELMPIPPSLAATNGSLHSTNKSVLANILTKHVQTPADVPLQEPSCLAAKHL
ncbi:Aerobic magnesium-protoporphyrin IX monomethyl ester [oxidative] cyclase [Dissostichus eleginoides]|uniref:Aerobic magnesium-protoporphyrin IX monomethyl ester [oxidative] cyclase n=1 Tax=Dissostichus eleginoides TaxID=100907 RepID=A0AAD9BBG6_DISEL|nr:Aerobic magnesium-protoporphyrin IX monomethyl ester [oxidative] cyclase [Dissostichus eleginoides]